MDDDEKPFHGDRPIESSGEDRLGFGLAARHVADAIHKMASPDGFVIGIEGGWGSGKSSFINLVSNALRDFGEDAPRIIRFLPWLISSRDGLLKELFVEITNAAIEVDSDLPPSRWDRVLLGRVFPKRYSAKAARKRKIRALFSGFSTRLVQTGKLAELFGLIGAGTAMEAGKRSIDEWLGGASLDREKGEIQRELRGLKRKIVVFIDDLDRLEPAEVTEVLRLVRAVVDFPNIVFVLCYSREVLVRNLSVELEIENGDSFLEKIVQVSFHVPKPEAFDLRRMFRYELQLLYPELLGNDDSRGDAVRNRLAQVVDDEGGRALLTPRHVVRAVNSLRFYATPVLACIDIPDMVWLQLVRLQSPQLHEWIERYLIEYSAKHAGATIAEESKSIELRLLNSIIDEPTSANSLRDARREALASNLPGISFDLIKQDGGSTWGLTLYGNQEVSSYVRDKRLGSPQHFRYYFALSAPQESISDMAFAIFLENAQHYPPRAVVQLTELASVLTPQGRVAAQPLLDRLKGGGIASVAPLALPGIAEALAATMDAAALTVGRGDWGEYWIWRDAARVLESIWKKIGAGQSRVGLTQGLFASGASIGWLTEILRGEIFDHGLYGDQKKPQDEWLLSEKELAVAAEELLRRYRELTAADLHRIPRVISVFYAWIQYDSDLAEEVKRKVVDLCREDVDFLKMLNEMRSWHATNDVVSYPLKASNVARFLNVEEVLSRLNKLAAGSDSNLARQASELVGAFSSSSDI